MPPGLTRDDVSLQRPPSTTDAEGNPAGALGAPVVMRGTWGTPSQTEATTADARGQQLDAVVAMATGQDVRLGDRITVRGGIYEVLAIVDTQIHSRYWLRRIGSR
jgi:head-tail adaptor